MTYFGVLFAFILPPLLILAIFVPVDLWSMLLRGQRLGRSTLKPYGIILAHVLIALIYTTPWDNYLVETGVWWYDPNLVNGLTIGYVPIEEYTFFIFQTLLTGLWTLAVLRKLSPRRPLGRPSIHLRLYSSLIVLVLWSLSLILLLTSWQEGTYLTLILSWALLPLLLQAAFGGDILRAHWRELMVGVLTPTLYLWLVDAIAIRSGTWTIDPVQTTGLALGGLPIEEMLFFLMTNMIVVFGITLMTAQESKQRAIAWLSNIRSWRLKIESRRDEQGADLKPNTGWRISAAFWLVLLIATPISLWIFGLQVFPLMATLGVLAQLVAVLVALSHQWNGARILRDLAVIVAFAWIVEWFGSSMGVPFGQYDYTQAMQPQIGGVPLIIPLAWAMMLFPAWAVSQVILRPYQVKLGRAYLFVFAVLSGLAFTAWDLYLDPQMVDRGLWFWETPGAYFGIPWLNFLGWWIVSTLITVIVRPKKLPIYPLLVIYTITWLFQAIGLGVFWNLTGPALTGFAGMGVFTIWAWRSLTVPWDLVFRWLPFQLMSRTKNPEVIVYSPASNQPTASDHE